MFGLVIWVQYIVIIGVTWYIQEQQLGTMENVIMLSS